MFTFLLALGVGFPFGIIPVPVADANRPRIEYIGRYSTPSPKNREPLILILSPTGGLSGAGDVNEDHLKELVKRECHKHKKVMFILGLDQPGETNFRTIQATVDRFMKYVPKGTKVTFYIRDDD
ncbi:MAG TPA: hypothetical protein VHR66_15960 [Gemmataceae bacterium]|jgi:hypothetical protein|nr:hypothetical protein [Gemmataceae bacterium]